MNTEDIVRGLLDGRVVYSTQPSHLDIIAAAIIVDAAHRGHTVDGLRGALDKGDYMTISEKTREILDRPVKEEKIAQDLANIGIEHATFRDYLVVMTLTRTANEGTAADLYALAELLGEREI